MIRTIISWFRVRKAIFTWKSNQSAGRVKVLFRGAFSQSESRVYALQNIVNMFRDGEVLEDLSFEGIEQ